MLISSLVLVWYILKYVYFINKMKIIWDAWFKEVELFLILFS